MAESANKERLDTDKRALSQGFTPEQAAALSMLTLEEVKKMMES